MQPLFICGSRLQLVSLQKDGGHRLAIIKGDVLDFIVVAFVLRPGCD